MNSIPTMTGDPRTDRALVTLARLLYEIAGNDEKDEATGPQGNGEGKPSGADSAPARPPPR